MLIILKFAFGACIGSFIYCVAEQLLTKQLNVRRRSCCAQCQQILQWYDLVPICSAILLHCRCRYCQHPFSPLHLGAEFLIGFVWSTCSPTWAIITTLLLAMSYCDLKAYWVPDTFQLLLLITCLYDTIVVHANVVALWYTGSIFILLFIVYQVYAQYIGGGDIKLMATLSLVIPFAQLPLFLMSAGICGLLHFAFLSFKNRKQPQAVPFIPSLALGVGIVQLFQLMMS
ncbi:prepilin peptidase [Aerococcaceae bacterium NML190938]|nr:prepilin peptidase [Aerococcaceae bacterium NML190938]